MRAVRNTDQGILVGEADEPEASGVRLTVVSAGICGTDVNFAAGGVQGYIYGHEFAGMTADGQSYAVEPTVYCGECDQCRAGHVQRCNAPEHGTLGMFRDGGMCDAVTVSENMLVPLPPGLDVHDACIVEPAAVAWHGIRNAALMPGERAAVVGGGSIGSSPRPRPGSAATTSTSRCDTSTRGWRLNALNSAQLTASTTS
ncbi:alcohol dehydrogenase catalytic domain-containing protein [Streptomyces sp. NPDC001588]|uniref:alcohol dehydrogenase catalytic domain-containing protein n=1 Tax=Streptomyces sp. NPDC093676 TaxID=3366050 RepID=UPI003807F052